MNPSRFKWICWLAAFPCLAPSWTHAQITNRSLHLRNVSRVAVESPVVVRPQLDRAVSTANVEIKMPKALDRYHVVEHLPQSTRMATNVTPIASDKFRAQLTPGSTLLFMEREPPSAVDPKARIETKPLFSTFILKASPPPRPGEPPRTDSGTLTILADAPTPWNGASNAYIARLSVMFQSADATTSNALLPMTVQLAGSNVTTIGPRKVELRQTGPDGSQDVLVVCDKYRPDVEITAYYQTTNSTHKLVLQRLTFWDMTQMIISVPMLFAALVGGLMGGMLRLFKGGVWKPVRSLHYLAEGVLVGIVTVTMLLAGLLHDQMAGMSGPPQLVMAFSLAAAAGSAGAHFLDKALARLSHTQDPA